MSILKSNQIATNDTNNVAMDNSLNLKSYTTFTGTEAFTFTGNYVYVKALVFNASAGSVESILLNH